MKIRQAALLVVLCVTVLGFAYMKLRSRPTKPQPELVNSSGLIGVIFPANSLEQGSWAPKKSDIVNAENGLPTFVKQAAQTNRAADSILKRGLSSYKRQYFGRLDGGEKVLFINFFCDDMGHDWQRKMIIVIDGGSCFFNVQYSIHTKKLSQLQINANP